MSETIGEPKLNITADSSGLKKGLDDAQLQVAAGLKKSEQLAAAGAKRIQRQIDSLNAVKPQKTMVDLAAAVQKMGGASALSSDQVARLKKQVDGLAAAGAKVPKALANLGGGAGLAGKAAAAAGGNLAGGLAPGGVLGAGLSAIGPAGIAAAAGIGAIAAAGKAASETIGALVERAGQLTDLSEKTGLSTDALQKLDFVGSQVGVSLDASAGAVLKLQRTLGEAAAGSKTAQQAFAAINVSWKDLIGLKPEEQFARVASALGTIPDQEELVARGADLMGRGFAEIIPLVKHAQEVLEAPVALDANTIKQVDDLGDSLTRLGKAGEELKTKLGVAFLSVLSAEGDPAKAIDTITDAVRGLSKIVTDPAFQTGIRALLGVATMGASEGVIGGIGALAKLGEADRMKGVAEFAKKFGEQNAQRAKDAEARAAKAAQDGRDKADREATAKAKTAAGKAAADRESNRKRTLEAYKQLADEERKFRDDTYRREHGAAEKFWDDQVKLAKDASDRIVADALVAKGLSPTQIGPHGEKLQIVSPAEMEAAKRRKRAADLGIDVSEVTDELLDAENKTQDVVEATVDWKDQLQTIANIVQGMPGGFGKVGNVVASLATGIAGIGQAKKGFEAASKVGGIGGLLGKASSLLGGVGAAVGLGQAIIGLFKKDPVEQAAKKAGQALGKTVSKELAQQFLEESKRTGQSIAQVAKKWQAEQDRAAADAKRKTVEEGIGAARSGLEALLGDVARLKDTPELQAAIAGIEAKVAEAVAKSGLGFLATGALRTSEAFTAVQGAAKSGGQVLAGMRQAGMVDAGLQGAMAGLAAELQRQAIDAAKAAGLSDVEAAKAGSGAIADILREQLNASLASGKDLDENTKAMLEEARKNGIEIVADPLLQQLKVQQDSLAELESIRSLMAGGSSPSTARFEGEPFHAQRGLDPVILPHMGGGLGPMIQTHPGELALVVPRSRVGATRLARFRGEAGEDGMVAGRMGSSAEAPISFELPIRFDHSVSFEQTAQFARAVGREVRRQIDSADPDLLRGLRRRLGRGA